MIRLQHVILLLAVPIAGNGHDVSGRWAAEFTDRACFVGKEFGPIRPTGFDAVQLSAYFFTPSRLEELQLPHMPDVVAKPVVLQIQILPSVLDRDRMKEEWSVYLSFDGESSELRRDLTVGSDDLPGFVLGGSAAAGAWTILRGSGLVSIRLEYGEEKSFAVDLEGDDIEVAAAMFDACVEGVRKGGRV